MKILFLTNLPSPYRVDFFSELGKLCELTVAFERSSASNRNENWKSSNEQLNYHKVYIDGINIGEESSLSFGFIKIINKNNFDVIVMSGYSSPTAMITILYLYLNRIPFVMSCDGGIIAKENKFKYFIKKFFISKASLWLSTGKVTSDYLKYYGAKENQIRMYPFSSIREEDIQIRGNDKAHYKSKLGISENKMILSVGQFIHRKGYDVLLRACSELDKDIGVYIIGGESTSEYNTLKKELELNNVHFLGFKSKEQLKEYYMAADIFILPTREDIWGLVINEAMAYGLPVITTNKCVAGIELVEDGLNGYIVPVENSQIIAERTHAILKGNKIEQMSSQSLKKIANYTIENMARINYLEISEFVKKLR